MLIVDVLEKELGKVFPKDRDFSIECPFHHDTNPSLRVYVDSDEGLGSFYCFGCGKFGRGIDFIKMYRNLSWYDALDYAKTVYGYVYEKSNSENRDFQLKEQLNLLCSEFYKSKYRVKALELAIKRYLMGDKHPLEQCIQKSFEMSSTL